MKHVSLGFILSVCLGLAVPQQARAITERDPATQIFYVPLPEDQVFTALTTIAGKASSGAYKVSNPLYSYVSIVCYLDRTVIYYDQWENGFDVDIANPVNLYSASSPAGTQIWGDGDPSNGYPPGYPDDLLNAGDVIVLESAVTTKTRKSVIDWDGGDKVGATKPIALSRAVWASGSKTLLAGANEVFDTSYFGTEFVCPVGTDTPDDNDAFEYTGFSIMASKNGTTIKIDKDADGIFETTVTLNEGEAYLINGGIKTGGRITASAPVQVELITGDIDANFESRFMRLIPVNLWTSSLTTPVATGKRQITSSTTGGSSYRPGGKKTTVTTNLTNFTRVYLYNPNKTKPISVRMETRDATVTTAPGGAQTVTYSDNIISKNIIIPAGGSAFANMESCATGAHFSSTEGDVFYAISVSDAGEDSTQAYDWGFALLPDDALATQIVVGLGLGRDPTSSVNMKENGAPAWVTTVGNGNEKVTVYVDYNGDNQGPYTDSEGGHYDVSYQLREYEILRVYDPDGDQTGTVIYTLDGTVLAGAWGGDPAKASTGEPGMDMGTALPPVVEGFSMVKDSVLGDDENGNGFLDVGESLKYSIIINNVGRRIIRDLNVKDFPPLGTAYVAGTAKFINNNGSEIAIANSGETAFPLDEEGYNIPEALPINGTFRITYELRVEDVVKTENITKLKNFAIVSNPDHTVTNSVVDEPRGSIGNFVWLDANKNGIQDADETGFAGIIARLFDAQGNAVIDERTGVQYECISGSDGAYLFDGVPGGDYYIEYTIPAALGGYGFAMQSQGGDLEKDSDANIFGRTEVFSLGVDEDKTDIDVGVREVGPDISLEKTVSYVNADENINISGDSIVITNDNPVTVTYTYIIRNIGDTYLNNIVLLDNKLGEIDTSDISVLQPSEARTITVSAILSEDTLNVALVSGNPIESNGTDIPGINDVSAGDYASVDIEPVPLPPFDPQPAIAIVKTAGDAADGTTYYAKKGSNVTYSYKISNIGNTKLVNVTITDDKIDGEIAKDLTLDVGEVRVVTKTVAINVGGETINIGTVVGTPADPETGDVFDDLGTISANDDAKVFVPDPNLTIAKTAASEDLEAPNGTILTVAAGDKVTYKYLITNTGNVALTNVGVTDDKLGTIGSIAELAPGASQTLTKRARIFENTVNIAQAKGSWTNNGLSGETDEVSDDAEVKVTVPSASVAITKIAGDAADGATLTIEKGDTVVYYYTVENTGSAALVNLTVTDDKLGAIGTIALLPASETTVLTKSAAIEEDTVNLATVIGTPAYHGDNGYTPYPAAVLGNVTDNDDAVVEALDPLVPEIYTEKTVAEYVAGTAVENLTYADAITILEGDQVVYKYYIENKGNTAIALISVIDDHLGTLVDGTLTLAAGESTTVYSDVITLAQTTRNIVNVKGSPKDRNGETTLPEVVAGDDAIVTVEARKNPAIAIVKTAGDAADGETLTLYTGTTIKYKYVVTNIGDMPLIDVKITDDKLGGIATLEGVLAIGESRTVFSSDVTINSDVTNIGSVEGTPADENGAADSDYQKVKSQDTAIVAVKAIENPAIEIVKLAVGAADGETLTVKYNGTVVYTYTIRNIGNVPLANVKVLDDKLGEIGTIANLAVGTETVLSKSAKLIQDTVNIATATGEYEYTKLDGTEVEGEVTDTDDATVEVLPPPTPAIKLTKTAGDAADGELLTVEYETAVTYSYFIENIGDTPLVSITLTDDKLGVILADEQAITLPVGGSTTVTATSAALVADVVNVGKVIARPAEDLGDGTYEPYLELGWVTDEDDAEVKVNPRPNPAIELIKTAGAAADGTVLNVPIGTDVVYTYKVTNIGNVTLSGITLVDDKLGEIETTWKNTLLPGEYAYYAATATDVANNVVNIGTVTAEYVKDDVVVATVTDSDNAVVTVYEPFVAKPGIELIKTANDTADGELSTILAGLPTTYYYLVKNTGNVTLTGITVDDDKEGHIGSIAALAPGASTTLEKTTILAENTINIGTVIGYYETEPVTDTDDAEVVVVTTPAGETPENICVLRDFGQPFNAIIFGDLTTSGGDTEGSLLVLGNAHLDEGYSVGYAVVGTSLGETPLGTDTLIVGGNLEIASQPVNGNIVYGGELSGDDRTYQGGIYELRSVNPVSIDLNGNVPEDGSGKNRDALYEQAKAFSAAIAGLAETGVEAKALDTGTKVLRANGEEARYVFAVTAEEISTPVWGNVEFEGIQPGAKIIVNVYGGEVRFDRGGITLPYGLKPNDLLFNYVNATNITMTHFEHNGSFIAPYANFQAVGASIQGQAIIGGNVTTTSGFEFHNFYLDIFECEVNGADWGDTVGIKATVVGALTQDELDDAVDGKILAIPEDATNFWVRETFKNVGTLALDGVRIVHANGDSETITIAAGETLSFDYLCTFDQTKMDNEQRIDFAACAYSADWQTIYASDYVRIANAFSPLCIDAEGSEYNATHMRPNFEVMQVNILSRPTITGETFRVEVVVANTGEISADAGLLSMYIKTGTVNWASANLGGNWWEQNGNAQWDPNYYYEQWNPDAQNADNFATAKENIADLVPVHVSQAGVIAAGETKSYIVDLAAAPFKGTWHVVAWIDSDEVVREWSEGDNFNNATIELEDITMQIFPDPDGVALYWNNKWGQVYSILTTTDLTDATSWRVYAENIKSARDDNTQGAPPLNEGGLPEEAATAADYDLEYNYFKINYEEVKQWDNNSDAHFFKLSVEQR